MTIEYYNMRGEPYDCKSGDAWYFRNPESGRWWSGVINPISGGAGQCEIRNQDWYLSSKYYGWMNNPGPGTPDIFSNPDFREVLARIMSPDWKPDAPVEVSHVGQTAMETPFGTVWIDDAGKKAGDLTIAELKALIAETLESTLAAILKS